MLAASCTAHICQTRTPASPARASVNRIQRCVPVSDSRSLAAASAGCSCLLLLQPPHGRQPPYHGLSGRQAAVRHGEPLSGMRFEVWLLTRSLHLGCTDALEQFRERILSCTSSWFKQDVVATIDHGALTESDTCWMQPRRSHRANSRQSRSMRSNSGSQSQKRQSSAAATSALQLPQRIGGCEPLPTAHGVVTASVLSQVELASFGRQSSCIRRRRPDSIIRM